MKRFSIIILILILVISSFSFAPIEADSQIYENQYGKLEVYPRNVKGFGAFEQTAIVTSKVTAEIDVAFVFNHSLNSGKLWRYSQGEWYNVSFKHVVLSNGNHAYVYENWNVVPKEYTFKWRYDPKYLDGKWDLYVKLSSDPWSEYKIHLDPWWNSSYNKFVVISFDSTFIDSNLNNYPALVRIPEPIARECDGGDSINFVLSDNSTELYFEIDDWQLNIARPVWVNVTKLYASGGTNILMYYNNSTCSPSVYHDPSNVWDNNFRLVSHLNDTTTSTTDDMTDNGNEGTKKAANEPLEENGGIGRCQYFDDNDDEIDHGTDSSLDRTDFVTMELWTYPKSYRYCTIFYKANAYNLNTHLKGQLFAYYYDSSGRKYRYDSPDNVLEGNSSYRYIAFTFDGDTNNIEYNVDANIYRGVESNTSGAGNDVSILQLGGYAGGGYTLDGWIGEARISDIVRNESWLNVTYYFFSNQSGFVTFQTPVIPAVPTNNTVPFFNWTSDNISSCPCCLNLGVQVTDPDGDLMNITFRSNYSEGKWRVLTTATNVTNGTIITCLTNFTRYDYDYFFNVSIHDGTDTIYSGIRWFTTDTFENCNSTTTTNTTTGSSAYRYEYGIIGIIGIFGILGLLVFFIKRKEE